MATTIRPSVRGQLFVRLVFALVALTVLVLTSGMLCRRDLADAEFVVWWGVAIVGNLFLFEKARHADSPGSKRFRQWAWTGLICSSLALGLPVAVRLTVLFGARYEWFLFLGWMVGVLAFLYLAVAFLILIWLLHNAPVLEANGLGGKSVCQT